MRWFIRKALLLSIGLGFNLLLHSQVKEYEITYLHNCKYVVINDKKMAEGDRFKDNMIFKWGPRQFIRVKEIGKNVELPLTEYGFTKYKAKTLGEYLTNEKTLYERSFNGQRDREFYLADSIHIQVENDPDPSFDIIEAICHFDNGKTHTSKIQKTTDNKYYIITPAVLGGRTADEISLDIIERSSTKDWKKAVYSGLKIIYFPK